jgi:hypothetical protein
MHSGWMSRLSDGAPRDGANRIFLRDAGSAILCFILIRRSGSHGVQGATNRTSPEFREFKETRMITTYTAIDYDALVKEDRIHGDVYLRPDVFEEEMDRIFHQGWVYVGHASEIPEPGDYRLSQIGRQSVIMTRDEAGQVHLLMNRLLTNDEVIDNLTFLI